MKYKSIKTLKKQYPNKIIGFTCGSFDLCHYGHVLMFEECKKFCDVLVVGLQSDPTIDRPTKNKPIQSKIERIGMLHAIKYISHVIEYDTENDLITLLKSLDPHIRIVGEDWRGKPFTGHKLNIKCMFNVRKHSHSSSNLRERVYLAEHAKRIKT